MAFSEVEAVKLPGSQAYHDAKGAFGTLISLNVNVCGLISINEFSVAAHKLPSFDKAKPIAPLA
ncbi:hypothetical protein D3C86_1584510 [compost metagenome]